MVLDVEVDKTRRVEVPDPFAVAMMTQVRAVGVSVLPTKSREVSICSTAMYIAPSTTDMTNGGRMNSDRRRLITSSSWRESHPLVTAISLKTTHTASVCPLMIVFRLSLLSR